MGKTPIRSYGRLTLDEQARLVVTYRPWLFLPARQLVLPTGNHVVGRGFLYPEVLRLEGESIECVLTLPPRYCGHEDEFNRIYRLAGIQNVGMQAIWEWFKSLFRSKPTAAATAIITV